MKQFFIFLFFIILLINLVGAIGFSPTKLIFKIESGEEECKTISLSSNSDRIMVSDQWAENKDIEWKISLFNKTSGFHNISISYPDIISSDNKNIKICLSGKKVEEYHGVVLVKEEQEGNTISQAGIWLKVTISEKQELDYEDNSGKGESDNDKNKEGGGGGTDLVNNDASDEDINEGDGYEIKKSQGKVLATVEDDEFSDKHNDKGLERITGRFTYITGEYSKIGRIIAIVMILFIIIGVFLQYRYKKIKQKRREDI